MHALHHLLRSAMVAGIVVALSGSLLQAQPYSHEVRSATIDDPSLTAPVGMIWIQAVGFGKKEVEAQRDAEVAALEALLFQGIANTQFSMPMVEGGVASREQHAAFYKTFFEQQGYRQFVSKTQLVQGLTKFKGGRKLVTRVLVDVNGLRRHLESNGVIRKFGM